MRTGRDAKVACWAVLALVPAAVAPTVAAATTFGLSEQHAASFLDPRFRALAIDHARLVVPWDAAITDPDGVGRWLSTVRGLGLTPLVAFEHGAAARCPQAPCALPSQAAYRDAVAAFRARWPSVREYTAWNEPNHPSQPTVSDPAAVAAFHDALVADCPRCTVTAGDLVDSASMRGWMRAYRAALTTEPEVWSLHNYGDTTYDRPSYTEWLLGQVTTPIWVTETGGIVRLAADGRDVLPADEARAAASMRKAIALVDAHPERIARAYAYQWAERPWEGFDSAVVRADGSERPSLAVLRAATGARPPRPIAGGPADESGSSGAATTTGAVPGGGAAAPSRSAHRRPVRVGRGYRLGLRCRPPRRSCRGRVTLSAAPAAGGRRIVLGTTRYRLRGGAWRSVVVPVSSRRLRRARALGGWQLVATILTRRPLTVSERVWEGNA